MKLRGSTHIFNGLAFFILCILSPSSYASKDESTNFKAAVLEAKLKDLTSEGLGGNWFEYGAQVRVDGDQALVTTAYGQYFYVLNYDGLKWTESAVIELESSFYYSDHDMEIAGDYIFIGNREESVIVFHNVNGSWTESSEIIPSQAEDPSNFGSSISVHENVMVVGAGSSSGEAYVFELVQGVWTETDILLPLDGNRSGFGSEVSIYDNKILLTSSEGIYFFKVQSGQWHEKQLLLYPENVSHYSDDPVVVGENHAAIGFPYHDGEVLNSGMVLTYQYNGTVWEFESSLAPPTPPVNARYGIAIALVDNELLVGSAGHLSSNSQTEGIAYLYNHNGNWWEQTNAFQAPDGHVNNGFGYSLALANDQALIGAFQDTGIAFSSGSVYVAKKNGNFWAINQKQEPAMSTRVNRMGRSTAVSGNNILLGVPIESSAVHGARSGAAIFYERQGQDWIQSTKLVANDDIENNFFGEVVCLAGDLAVISADVNHDAATGSGAIYVFEHTNGIWTQTSKLTSNNGQVLGRSCDIFENRFIIGYHNYSYSAGGAFVYEKLNGQWQEIADLVANDGQVGDYFGDAVAMGDDIAFVGAKYEKADNPLSGAVYIFENTAGVWQQTNKLRADDPISYDYFGSSISHHGNQLLVGTTGGGGTSGQRTGTAYLFEQSGNQWLEINHFIPNDVPANNQIYFGDSVSLADGRVAVGSIYSGVYVYELTNGLWLLVDRFFSDYMIANASYSEPNHVSLDGDLLVYGSANDNDLFASSGAAYVHNYAVNPVAANDDFSILEDSTDVMLDVISNDKGNAQTTIVSVTQPQNGQTSVVNNQVQYTPNANYCNDGQSNDQFSYELNGGSTADVQVSVTCVNDQPGLSRLGSQVTQTIGLNTVAGWAYEFEMGAADEDQTQSVQQFIVTIETDAHQVLSSASMSLDGTLSYVTTGQLGEAYVTIRMQDDGGVANGGVDMSSTYGLFIKFDDVIFDNGFE